MNQRLKTRLKDWLQRSFFLRIHMLLILTGTFLAGLVCTKVLLELHVDVLAIRYVVAVAVAYVVFLVLVRVWLWYVRIHVRDEESFDIPSDVLELLRTGSTGADAALTGGGEFGGGGASGSWGDSQDASTGVIESAGTGAGTPGGFDLDEGTVVVLFTALLLGIFVAGGYVIYAAPTILADAAIEALLAAALARRARRIDSPGWTGSVVRATALPLAAVLVFAALLGIAVNVACPDARRVRDVLSCLY